MCLTRIRRVMNWAYNESNIPPNTLVVVVSVMNIRSVFHSAINGDLKATFWIYSILAKEYCHILFIFLSSDLIVHIIDTNVVKCYASCKWNLKCTTNKVYLKNQKNQLLSIQFHINILIITVQIGRVSFLGLWTYSQRVSVSCAESHAYFT